MIRIAKTVVFALVVVAGCLLYWKSTRRMVSRSMTRSLEPAVEGASTAAPQDEEACFSPDERCDVKLIKFVDSAQPSLDVAIYDITLDELVHHILLKAREARVRVVVDRVQAKDGNSSVPLLVKAGVQVRYGRQRGVMHNKFVIVDEQAVELGSFNFTNAAAQKNSENQLYLRKPRVVERYLGRFERLWKEGTDVVE